MRKLIVATAVMLAMFGWADEVGPVGVQLRGMMTFNGTALSERSVYGNNWFPFDDSAANCTAEWGYAGPYVFDAGSPKVVKRVGLVLRNSGFGQTRAAYFNCYGSNDRNNLKGELLCSNKGTTLAINNVTNWFANPSSTAYRYYAWYPGSDYKMNYHVFYYSDDVQIVQNRTEVFNSATVADAGFAGGPKFSGAVRYLPDGGTAEVVVLVAKTDHDNDYAAWIADATCVSYAAGDVAQGGNWAVQAGGLTPGRWYGRAFALYGGQKVASQTSVGFAIGTGVSTMTAYFQSSSSGTIAWQCYDGSLSTLPDTGNNNWIVFANDNPDVELVGVRLWARADGWFYQGAFAAFAVTTNAGDFGVVTDNMSCKTRTLKWAEKDPTSDWKQILRMQEADMFLSATRTGGYYEMPMTLPYRHVTYLKMYNVKYNFRDVEFRTLPRPAEPEAQMAVASVGGTYLGLAGYLDYRGNAASDCDIYVSCVEKGEPANYALFASAWANETKWTGTYNGLKSETEYDLRVIVSNALAGVTALVTNVTTGVYVVEPATVDFTSVTPNRDGTVTFAWDVISLGTDATKVDIYAKWGADAEHLGAGVKIKSDVGAGVGSVAVEGVTPGEDLVFVLYTVNDQSKTSEDTASKGATTYGPCAIKDDQTTIVRTADGFKLTVDGRLSERGLGNTDVYLNWGATEGALDHFVKITTITPADEYPLFNLTAYEPDVDRHIWARVVVSNAWNDYVWGDATDEQLFTLGVKVPCKAWRTPGACNTEMFDLYDGLTETTFKNATPYYFDLGVPHTLSGVRLGHNSNGEFANLATLSIWTSLDGEHYTLAWTNETGSAFAAGVMNQCPIPKTHPQARYVRIDTAGNKTLQCYELHIEAADLVLNAKQTQPWGAAGNAPLLSDERKNRGLYFSGSISSGSATHIYACVANRDCGNDLAAWQAAGTVKDLGPCARGGTYSGWLAVASTGRVYTKTFATDDVQVVCDPHENRTQAHTQALTPPLYVSTSSDVLNSYDGNVSTCTDNTTGGTHWFTFPIARTDIVIDAIRVWIRTDSHGDRRYLDLKVEETEDDTPFAYTEVRSTPRVIRTYAADPTTGWTSVGGTAWRSDFAYGCFTCMDVPIMSPLKNPKYLRIGNAAANHFYEIELRYHRRPGSFLRLR